MRPDVALPHRDVHREVAELVAPYVPQNVPADGRQGGDTILDAVAIALPYSGTGTTVGYNDDTDESCPYDGSTSPDVVYSATPAADIAVDFTPSPLPGAGRQRSSATPHRTVVWRWRGRQPDLDRNQ